MCVVLQSPKRDSTELVEVQRGVTTKAMDANGGRINPSLALGALTHEIEL